MYFIFSCLKAFVKPSFHMIAHDRAGSLKILPAIVIDYMETLFSDRAIVSDPTFQ